MNKTYRHLSTDSDVHQFCTRTSHWASGSHPLSDLSNPLSPVWHQTCQLNTVEMTGGGRFTFDASAANGSYIESQCLAHGEVEVV